MLFRSVATPCSSGRVSISSFFVLFYCLPPMTKSIPSPFSRDFTSLKLNTGPRPTNWVCLKVYWLPYKICILPVPRRSSLPNPDVCPNPSPLPSSFNDSSAPKAPKLHLKPDFALSSPNSNLVPSSEHFFCCCSQKLVFSSVSTTIALKFFACLHFRACCMHQKVHSDGR